MIQLAVSEVSAQRKGRKKSILWALFVVRTRPGCYIFIAFAFFVSMYAYVLVWKLVCCLRLHINKKTVPSSAQLLIYIPVRFMFACTRAPDVGAYRSESSLELTM